MTPVMTKIPGFPDIKNEFKSQSLTRNFNTLSTKQDSICKERSALKYSRLDDPSDIFLKSIINSTKAGEDDTSFPHVQPSVNSSLFGTRDVNASPSPQQSKPNMTIRDNNNLSF